MAPQPGWQYYVTCNDVLDFQNKGSALKLAVIHNLNYLCLVTWVTSAYISRNLKQITLHSCWQMGRKPWSTEGKSNVCPSKPADHPLTPNPCSLYYCTRGMFQEVTQEGWLQRQIQEHRSTDQAVVFDALWVTTDCISWAPNHFVKQAFCAKNLKLI